MGKISYSDHVKKSDISVVIAEIIFQSLQKTHKLLPLSDVVNTSSGGTPSRTNQSYYGGEIPWLKSGEMNDSSIAKAEEFITEEGLNNSSAKIFPKGTLLVAMYGATAGKTGILDIDASTNQAVCAVTPKDKNTNRDFLFWFFRANRFYFIDISRGGAQPNISQSVIGNTDFPIVEEGLQKNIALFLSNLEQTKKADYSLIPSYLCKPVKLTFDYLSCLQNLERENKKQANIVSQLKQAILQEAIAGQLTAEWRTQNPMQKGNPDTDAAALLAKIKGEKQQLIAEGKLKKETKQDSISESSLLIPDTWENPFLGDITKQITDGTHQTPNYVINGKTFLSAQNVKPFRFIPENHRYITEQAFLDCRKNRVPEKGDLLIARVGAGIGETAVLDRDIEFAFYVSLGLVKVFRELTNSDYLAIVCNSPYGVQYAKGNVSSSGVSAGNYNLGRIRSLKIPLPPLAEQKVIAEKVDRLMETIDQLEQQIKHRKQLAEDLMQTVLREAFE